MFPFRLEVFIKNTGEDRTDSWKLLYADFGALLNISHFYLPELISIADYAVECSELSSKSNFNEDS